MPTKPQILLFAAGTPAEPPPPEPPPTCHECGNCLFSANSILDVTQTAWLCNEGNPSSTKVKQSWPFLSASATFVEWRLNATNFARYNCTINRWEVTASASSFDTSDVCLSGSTGTLQLDQCSQVTIWHVWNNNTFEIFNAVVTLNNCIPSIPV